MAVAIESFGVSTVDIFGFSPPLITGFADQISSTDTVTNGDLSIFGGQNLRSLLWQNSTGLLYLEVYGCHENGGFDYINFNGLTFNRTSATYSVTYNTSATASDNYSEGGVWTTWSWSRSTNPFSTATTETVTFYHNGAGVPAFGDITMNEIHLEAGGSSGTQVSLNDSDVRAKSWYARVVGSTPASGATNSMGDYYWPTHIPENQNDQRRRLLSSSSTDTNYKIAHAFASTLGARTNGVFDQAKCGMTIETDGTDTEIKFRLSGTTNHVGTSTSKTITLQYWDDTGSGTSNAITYNDSDNAAIILPGVRVSEAALLTSQHSESITTGTNPVGTPNIGSKTYDTAGFGETLMSTNSLTSFVTLADNTQYGRSFSIQHTINPQTVSNTVFESSVTIKFRWALRAKPQTAGSDTAKCYLLKNTTLNYAITLLVQSQKVF